MAEGRRFGPAIEIFWTKVHPGGRGEGEIMRRGSAVVDAVNKGRRVACEMRMLAVGLFGGGGRRAHHW